ncbi:hypothetical protein G6F36_015296 [Rhizopus arrhizus]|nr:hypothetical protein G6F36_015296 [Rhizopus arrhizus]
MDSSNPSDISVGISAFASINNQFCLVVAGLKLGRSGECGKRPMVLGLLSKSVRGEDGWLLVLIQRFGESETPVALGELNCTSVENIDIGDTGLLNAPGVVAGDELSTATVGTVFMTILGTKSN